MTGQTPESGGAEPIIRHASEIAAGWSIGSAAVTAPVVASGEDDLSAGGNPVELTDDDDAVHLLDEVVLVEPEQVN